MSVSRLSFINMHVCVITTDNCAFYAHWRWEMFICGTDDIFKVCLLKWFLFVKGDPVRTLRPLVWEHTATYSTKYASAWSWLVLCDAILLLWLSGNLCFESLSIVFCFRPFLCFCLLALCPVQLAACFEICSQYSVVLFGVLHKASVLLRVFKCLVTSGDISCFLWKIRCLLMSVCLLAATRPEWRSHGWCCEMVKAGSRHQRHFSFGLHASVRFVEVVSLFVLALVHAPVPAAGAPRPFRAESLN